MHSALGMPLTLFGQMIGVLTVYAYGTDAVDAHATDLGERFAAPAAVTAHNARVLARAQRLTTQMETALTGQAIIDQAVGILISHCGGTAAESLARLRATQPDGARSGWADPRPPRARLHGRCARNKIHRSRPCQGVAGSAAVGYSDQPRVRVSPG